MCRWHYRFSDELARREAFLDLSRARIATFHESEVEKQHAIEEYARRQAGLRTHNALSMHSSLSCVRANFSLCPHPWCALACLTDTACGGVQTGSRRQSGSSVATMTIITRTNFVLIIRGK